MFVDPQRTPQDVNFQIFGIPCRIHPYFWLGALFFAFPRRENLPGNIILALLISRMACLFVSILVHELGHAVLIRWAGFRPEVVLHAFGGLALYIPHRPIRAAVSVAISFAGPAAGFILYGIVRLIAQWLANTYPEGVHPVLADAILQLEWINLVWGLVNLLPIFPLDGGQISRTLLESLLGRKGLRTSLIISIIASAGTALFFYEMMGRQLFSFPVILFALLCYESIQAYQALSHGSRW